MASGKRTTPPAADAAPSLFQRGPFLRLPDGGPLGYVFQVWLAAIILVYVYLSYLAPISGDMWANVEAFHDASLQTLIFGGLNSYDVGNPRIGENLVKLTAESRLLWVVVCTLVFVFYLYATTRFIRVALAFINAGAAEISPVLVAVLVASATFVLVPLPGPAILYPPFEHNYIFGISLLLSALGVVLRRLGVVLQPAASAMPAPVETRPQGSRVAILGQVILCFVAGLSNEHTVIAALGLLALVLAYLIFRRRGDSLLFIYVAALAAGYAFLYFAPGEAVRYQGVGEQHLASYFIRNAEVLTRSFSRNCTIPMVASIAMLVLSLFGAWVSRDHAEAPIGRRLLLVVGGLFLLAWGSCAAFLFAPFYVLPPVWAARVFIPFGVLTICMVLIVTWAAFNTRAVNLCLIAGLLGIWVWRMAVMIPIYVTTREDVIVREYQIRSQLADGKRDVIVEPYRFNGGPSHIFVDRSASEEAGAPQAISMWRYYGVDSVTEKPAASAR